MPKPIGFKTRLRLWLHNLHPSQTAHSWLGRFAHRLTEPKLWHLNRHTVAKGVAIGLLVAFIPIPGQSLFASLLAILLGANLPISVIITWVTNPFTFIPILYATYWIGNLFLRMPTPLHLPVHSNDLSYSAWFIQIWHWLLTLGKPLLLGIPLLAGGTALLGYMMTLVIWNSVLRYQLKQRKQARHRRTP